MCGRFYKNNLNRMVGVYILKGVGIYRADALAIDLNVKDCVALIRGESKGVVVALADTDITGRAGTVCALDDVDCVLSSTAS